MSENEFKELQHPQSTPWGWYVATVDDSGRFWKYLHSDVELHSSTAGAGYFATKESANTCRDLYYAKYNTPVIKQHNADAWERAMKGLK